MTTSHGASRPEPAEKSAVIFKKTARSSESPGVCLISRSFLRSGNPIETPTDRSLSFCFFPGTVLKLVLAHLILTCKYDGAFVLIPNSLSLSQLRFVELYFILHTGEYTVCIELSGKGCDKYAIIRRSSEGLSHCVRCKSAFAPIPIIFQESPNSEASQAKDIWTSSV